MHALAEREAVRMGPRVSQINGEFKMSYYLTKRELGNLFRRNGFNTKRSAWLDMIVDWMDTWEEKGPAPQIVQNKDEDGWRIYFTHVSQSDAKELMMQAENQGIPSLAVAE